jgi:hypothetical protein
MADRSRSRSGTDPGLLWSGGGDVETTVAGVEKVAVQT